MVEALRGVTCRIPKGRFAFIVGPSGSGKSTLLYLLGALDRPTSGTISVDGHDLTAMSEAEQNAYRRDRVGFIFQSFNLISNLTALENVLVPFLPTGVTPEQREQAVDLLTAVGLGDRLDHRPYQLSGGEQQRVAIARALIKDPVVVLADEPTGELDRRPATRSTGSSAGSRPSGRRPWWSSPTTAGSSAPTTWSSRSRTACSRRPRGQSRRTTLPKPRFDDTDRPAAANSSKAKTRSTTGRTSPRSSQGTTRSANRRVAAIFSSSGRARSVVPTIVEPLRHQGARSIVADEPPSRPTTTSRPRVASEREVRPPAPGPPRRSITTCTPPPSVRSRTTSAKSSRDESMATSSPSVRGLLQLVGRPRRPEDRAPHRVGDLDGRRADPAADRVDQDPLARPDPPLRLEGVVAR